MVGSVEGDPAYTPVSAAAESYSTSLLKTVEQSYCIVVVFNVGGFFHFHILIPIILLSGLRRIGHHRCVTLLYYIPLENFDCVLK